MDLTKSEIKNEISRKNNFTDFERLLKYTFNRDLLLSEKELLDKIIDESMEKYAEQEAKAYANWLSYQEVGDKTATELWNEYRNQF